MKKANLFERALQRFFYKTHYGTPLYLSNGFTNDHNRHLVSIDISQTGDVKLVINYSYV